MLILITDIHYLFMEEIQERGNLINSTYICDVELVSEYKIVSSNLKVKNNFTIWILT